jgi:hypothetical protein
VCVCCVCFLCCSLGCVVACSGRVFQGGLLGCWGHVGACCGHVEAVLLWLLGLIGTMCVCLCECVCVCVCVCACTFLGRGFIESHTDIRRSLFDCIACSERPGAKLWSVAHFSFMHGPMRGHGVHQPTRAHVAHGPMRAHLAHGPMRAHMGPFGR